MLYYSFSIPLVARDLYNELHAAVRSTHTHEHGQKNVGAGGYTFLKNKNPENFNLDVFDSTEIKFDWFLIENNF